mmetsp:Transcript_76082/g.122897  ORF Transcript_76082/g.122897 Transcript_76082/m.122897 type:complete len:222 (+) Transcript_76082:205-870(+)
MESTDDVEAADWQDDAAEPEAAWAEATGGVQAKARARKGRRGKGKGQDAVAAAPAAGGEVASALTANMVKTRMCQFFEEGRCKYSDKCAFAHNESELRGTPDLRKTRLCRAFSQGTCNDRDCKFAHGNDELRETDICYKTALCSWFEKGNCSSGADCRFAHGDEELREDPEGAALLARRAAGGKRSRGQAFEDTQDLPVCRRCGSTIATNLGMTNCVVCRH